MRRCDDTIPTPARASGFTLLELMAVVAILGLLAALVLSTLGGMRSRGRLTAARVETESIEGALRAYYAEYKRWPADVNESGSGVAVSGVLAETLSGEPTSDNERGFSFIEFARLHPDEGNDDPVSPWARGDRLWDDEDVLYYVKCDVNYDGTIVSATNDAPPDVDVRLPVIVWVRNLDVEDEGDEDAYVRSWK